MTITASAFISTVELDILSFSGQMFGIFGNFWVLSHLMGLSPSIPSMDKSITILSRLPDLIVFVAFKFLELAFQEKPFFLILPCCLACNSTSKSSTFLHSQESCLRLLDCLNWCFQICVSCSLANYDGSFPHYTPDSATSNTQRTKVNS